MRIPPLEYLFVVKILNEYILLANDYKELAGSLKERKKGYIRPLPDVFQRILENAPGLPGVIVEVEDLADDQS